MAGTLKQDKSWLLMLGFKERKRFKVVYSSAQFLVVFPCFLCFSVSSICLPLFSWSLRVFCPFISCLCLAPDSLIVSTCSVYLSSEFILCLLQVLIWGFRFYRIFWIFLNLNFCFRWINCSLLFHLYVGKVLQHAVDEHYELYINPNKTTEGKLLLISALL